MDKWRDVELERDVWYWRKLIAEASGYVKHYHVRNHQYETREIGVEQERVQAFIIQQGCSRMELFGSVFALYLSRINRMGGCLLRTNLRGEEAGTVGLRTLMRIDVKGEQRFTDLIRGFRDAYATAAEHTKADVEQYVGDTASSYAVYELTGAQEQRQADHDDGAVLACSRDDGVVLALEIGERSLNLRYHTEVFSDIFIDHMVKNLESLIASVLKDPEQAVSDIDILSEEEKALLSAYTRGKPIAIDAEKMFSQTVREHAKKNPDLIAVNDGVHQISYGELEKKSNSIAQDLAERYQIGPGSRVAIMLPRTYHFPMLVLALNKIGAAYVPVDLRLPMNRIDHMLRISEAEHLITTRGIGETLRVSAEIICLEDLNDARDIDIAIRTRRDDLFAILFTSGTTGVPKGIMFYNKQFPWGGAAFADLVQFSSGDRVGSCLSFSFVASFIDCVTLYLGGTLRLFNEEEQKDSLLLVKALKETHLKSLLLPPAMGIPIYEQGELNLDYLMLVGAKLNELSKKERHTKLVNLYGTTEVIFAISKFFDKKDNLDDRVPLGKPVANTWAYILDSDSHQMPLGVPGEICISGGLCAPGYCNDPELTARLFVPNPYAEGEINAIMYRTGDIGYYNFDGEIEIIGREDNQLSVRGFRIEANEILGIMKGFGGIEETYLDVENDTLIAYYTAKKAVNLEEIKEALKKELPYYMIPSLFIRLEKIPLNLNGKIDKAQLKTAVKQEQIEITDETLRIVVDAFREVLRVDQVGVDDEFVALGGNSLAAMKLLLILNEKLGVSLSANELMGLSTPTDIVNYIKNSADVRPRVVEDKYSFDGACPLTECQLNVYLDEQVHEMGTAYNNPFKITFADGKQYPPEKIMAVLGRLVEAFPVLRARVIHQDDELRFVFDAEPEIAKGAADAVTSFVRPFETDRGLVRFLIAKDWEKTVLCADFHHLIFDGTSLNVLLRRLFGLLNGEEAGAADRGILREAAFEEGIDPERMEEAHAFFDQMLADQEEAYPLLSSVKGPEDTEEEYEYLHSFDIDPEALRRFLKTHAMTENQFFAGVFAYTLSRFSGSERALFNLIEDGRGHIDLSDSVGMYVKTLPVLMDCRDRETASFLADASEMVNSAMMHDLYPFRLLAKEYGVQANILFQYSHQLFDDAIHQEGMEYAIEELKHDQKSDMSFFIFQNGEDSLGIRVLYSSTFAKAFIERFVESFRMILDGMMREKRLGDIQYTTDHDLEIMNRYNQTEIPLRYDDLLDAFNDNLAKYPGNKLVEYKDQSCTWAEGAWIVDQIRQKLLDLGCGAGDRIGFLIPRSEGYLFSALGILALGAAYVPLDDTLPDERIGFMIRDTGAKVLIVSDETAERARNLAGEGIALLNFSDILQAERGRLERLPIASGKIACILYTSGSTGVPKGVQITRKALNSFLDFNVRDLGILPGDVIGLYASIGFDVSMEGLFSVLYTGACLNVIPDDVRLNIQALNAHFMKYQVDYIHLTTQIARLFISQIEETSLKALITGGEKLGKVEENRKYRIVDTYGPTEACVYITSIDLLQKIDAGSVGFILDNAKAYILDDERRRAPIGAVGGLYLSGAQLADGYLNREEETARAFPDNPYEENAEYGKIYDTGDVARMLPDGTYDIIGRRDGQVKIRGNRVELSEVEAVLRNLEAVLDATVQVANRDGSNELVAYVVSELGEETLGKAVAQEMSGRLPAYMVPSFVIKVDRIPVNVNGKVDRRALPAVDFDRYHAAYVSPRNEAEAIVAKAFEQVFQRGKVGINDDFIRLGGDSLTAMKLVSILGEYGVSVLDIMGLRTPASIAKKVRPAANLPFNLDLYDLESGCPLNNAQAAVFNDIIRNHRINTYLIPILIPIPKKYSVQQIRDALDRVFTAHPVLSMRIEMREDGPWMVKGEKPMVVVEPFDPERVLTLLTNNFDFFNSMARCVIVEGDESNYLAAVAHHLIFDAVSGDHFRRVFLLALEGAALDYVDVEFLKLSAFHQQMKNTDEYAQVSEFAEFALGDVEDVGFLTNPDGNGKAGILQREVAVNSARLERLIARTGVNRNTLFTAIMGCALSSLTGKEQVIFGSLDHGRDRLGQYDAIGLFVNVLPIVADLGSQSVASFLEGLSDMYYQMLQYNFYPFGMLAQNLGIKPLVVFQYFPDWIAGSGVYDQLPVDESVVKKIVSGMGDNTMDVLAALDQKGDRYTLRIVYTSYYTREIMEKLAETYQRMLTRVIGCDPEEDIRRVME